ncbi:hypothetical protein MNBD_GAMMA11-970 [hydrothermal vent metagenome]|uniref:J domain-containing protein n=1 Tax=hydrothermal vent metagenome TaxID=652676 RepID=A0A3B0XFC9_9ZZZZ
MQLTESLSLEILSILKSTDNDLCLYDLMQRLEAAGYDLADCDRPADDFNVKMFRKNFIVMNGLYQLHKDLSGSGYCLFISSLKIAILPDNVEKSGEVKQKSIILTDESNHAEVENVASDRALAEYYLNWDNFNTVDKYDVDRLLIEFWERFALHTNHQQAKDRRSGALEVLALEPGADWADIQSAYRNMVAKIHPDKGGESSQFIKVREAYLVLKSIRML